MEASSKNDSKFRILSKEEIDLVAGGYDDGSEIVVTATKEQVKAAWDSYYSAQAQVSLSAYVMTGVIGAAAGASGLYGGVFGTIAGGAGFAIADRALDNNEQAAVDGLATVYYQMDGADGVFGNDAPYMMLPYP